MASAQNSSIGDCVTAETAIDGVPAAPNGAVEFRGLRMPACLVPWLGQAQALSWRQIHALPQATAMDGNFEVVEGDGLLAEQPCPFRVSFGAHLVVLDLLSCEQRFVIDAQGRSVTLISDGAADLQTLLGPPLVLALALQGRYCLHASAVLAPKGNGVLFSADSGVGKSTLARTAMEQGWRRLSDDITPLNAAGQICPRFPQLKLAPGIQAVPLAVPLQHVLSLQRGRHCELQRLNAAALARLLLAATVGARMYSSRMQIEHFQWATGLSNAASAPGAWQLTLANDRASPSRAAAAALALLCERLG